MDSEILFEYKTIQLIRSRMASHFLVKLNFNEIENEQRSVILIYMKTKYLHPGRKTRTLSHTGSFNFYVKLESHCPPLRFFFNFVNGGCCVVQWWWYRICAEKSLILAYRHRRGWSLGRLCTQAVYTRPTQNICNPKEHKTWTPSTTHYPQTPLFFLILWMVDVVSWNDDDIENMQRRVLFLDIITAAAGRMGDCVHKQCTQGLRRTYFIQKNLKLGPHRPPITHKIY